MILCENRKNPLGAGGSGPRPPFPPEAAPQQCPPPSLNRGATLVAHNVRNFGAVGGIKMNFDYYPKVVISRHILVSFPNFLYS